MYPPGASCQDTRPYRGCVGSARWPGCTAGLPLRFESRLELKRRTRSRRSCRKTGCREVMKVATTLDIDKILQILPHRWPFVMVDRVTEIVPNERILGHEC